ncbi:L-aspartate oxidase [soil metagenome]
MDRTQATLLSDTRIESAHVVDYDAVVIGAGVAGLTFALRLPQTWRIALLTKGTLGESNTRYAQGGISAAIGPDDSPVLHEEDTLEAGANLCDPESVAALVNGAPEAVRWLLEIGAKFDRDATSGEIELGKEAAHSRNRVLHAGGDATGAEVERAMVDAVKSRPYVDIYPHVFAIDLAVEDGICTGLYCEVPGRSEIVRFRSQIVVLAAGGAGQLWAISSNPSGATADGLAMALRAGVSVADLEFVQFHPTVLAVPGTEAFLVTEAVRGDGAYLLDSDNRRFMLEIHPLAELAPRDVVARAIQTSMAASETAQVYLDLRHLDNDTVHRRFPTISRELRARGLDLANDLVPVAPAAHYFIGGIASATNGSTSLPGLLALGEAACSGVHGANRLASNSLLEGLVFGFEAANVVAATCKPVHQSSNGQPLKPRFGTEQGPPLLYSPLTETAQLVRKLQEVMSQNVAVVRDSAGLEHALQVVQEIENALASIDSPGRHVWESRNLAIAARAVIASAIARQESRGAHFRSDFPDTDPKLDHLHSLLPNGKISNWCPGSLEDAILNADPLATSSANGFR